MKPRHVLGTVQHHKADAVFCFASLLQVAYRVNCTNLHYFHDFEFALYRTKPDPKTKSQAGLVRCLEPWKNINISEVVVAQIC